jgi:hypothetical protein
LPPVEQAAATGCKTLSAGAGAGAAAAATKTKAVVVRKNNWREAMVDRAFPLLPHLILLLLFRGVSTISQRACEEFIVLLDGHKHL